jgi:hypothetical protein
MNDIDLNPSIISIRVKDQNDWRGFKINFFKGTLLQF